MSSGKAPPTVGAQRGAQRRNRNRRGVGGQPGRRLKERVEAREDASLQLRAFEHRLDDEVAVGMIVEPVHGLQIVSRHLALLGAPEASRSPAFDENVQALQRFVGRSALLVRKNRRMAGQREHQRNFRPHHTRADDADFFERPHFKPLHHDKPRRSRVDIFYASPSERRSVDRSPKSRATSNVGSKATTSKHRIRAIALLPRLSRRGRGSKKTAAESAARSATAYSEGSKRRSGQGANRVTGPR